MKIIKSKPRANGFSEDDFLNVHTGRVILGMFKSGHILGATGLLTCFLLFCLTSSTFFAAHALLYIFAFDGKMSGRMDGNVLMRNGRGRAFAVPALVRNSYTITARALFASFSSGYAGLTAAQVLAWSNFTMSVSNRMGQAKQIKGKDCYVRLNVNLTLIGAGAIADPPVLTGVVTPITSGVLTATAATGVVSLTFAPTPTATSTWHLVFATKPLGNGITRPSKSAYRLITVIQQGTASPKLLTTQYAAKFGSILTASGQKMFLSLTAIDGTSGQAQPSVGISTTII